MAKVMLIGKQRGASDYVGARTLYLFKTLTQAGIDCSIWDWQQRSREMPLETDVVVWLPWVQELSCGWLRLLRCFSGKRYLWTEQFDWAEQRRALIAGKGNCELTVSDVFSRVCYATNEDMETWGMQAGHAFWPVLVHEDMVPDVTHPTTGSVVIDSYWPYEWSDGRFNARAAIDDALAREKAQLGTRLVAPPDPLGVYPAWVDDQISAAMPHARFIEQLSQAYVYVTTHHELLGLQQFEALMCGTPVVVAREHAPAVLGAESPGVVYWANADDQGNALAPVDAGLNFWRALQRAITLGSDPAERAKIRAHAVRTWGSVAWWSRCSEYFDTTRADVRNDLYAALDGLDKS